MSSTLASILPKSNGSKVGNQFVAAFLKDCANRSERERAWVAELIVKGYKAAHPDDGWVDRSKNSIVLSYPYFNSGLKINDIMALGCPEEYRTVKISKIEISLMGLTHYHFVEVHYMVENQNLEYVDPKSQKKYFICDGISMGKSWGTFFRNDKGKLKRFKSILLPMRDTKEEAVKDLKDYAEKRGFVSIIRGK